MNRRLLIEARGLFNKDLSQFQCSFMLRCLREWMGQHSPVLQATWLLDSPCPRPAWDLLSGMAPVLWPVTSVPPIHTLGQGWLRMRALRRFDPEAVLRLQPAREEHRKLPTLDWVFLPRAKETPTTPHRLVTHLDGYPTQHGEAILIPAAATQPPCPTDWTHRQQIKVQYSGGQEFFLVRGNLPTQDQMQMLLAFSFFKKRTHSQLQLVIASSRLETPQVPREALERFRYRGEVHVHTRLREDALLQVIGAAYGLLAPAAGAGLPDLLEAFEQQAAVISSGPVCDAAPEAVLRPGGLQAEDWAAAMVRLYNEEALREQIIRNAAAFSAAHPFSSALEAFSAAMDAWFQPG